VRNQIINLIRQFLKSVFQHIRDLFEVWMAAQTITDNFAIEQIKNWRQIEFLVMHLERSKMCCEEARQVAAVPSGDISA